MIFAGRAEKPLFQEKKVTEYYISRLSNKRIILSALMVFLLRPLAEAVNYMIHDSTIAWMFALNIMGSLLIMYDWNLFGIHYNRAKANKGDFLIYGALGLFLIGGWMMVNIRWIHGSFPLPDRAVMKEDLFALPAILAAYSFLQSSVVNIGFKCLTDHLKVRSNELQIILLSGIIFGVLYTLITLPQLSAALPTLVYHVVLVWILSYLYNQSNSFMPGLCAMTIIYFALQLTLMI